MVKDSDEELMFRYSSGDAAAFEALFNRHKDSLYRFLLWRCESQAVAEELAQDVWEKIINASKNMQLTTSFRAYLFQIAKNRVVDHYRKVSPETTLKIDDADMDIIAQSQDTKQLSAERQSQLMECVEELYLLLEQLPMEQKEIIILREESLMTLEELASSLGEERETLKSRLRYALKKLRKNMPEDCLDE